MVIRSAELVLTQMHTPRLEVVVSTGSTNADLLAHSHNAADWPHMSAVLTDDQTAGRGRLDRAWQAPPGASIALSVLVRADRIPAAAVSWLPLIAGLAMTEAIAAQLGSAVAAKWPNDVLVGDDKICGILAEIAPNGEAIVVGSGVNTAMTADEAPVKTATSFAMLATSVHLDMLISHYLARLAAEIDALAAADGDADQSGLRARFMAQCTTIGRIVTVHLPGGESLTGEAVDVDRDGRLVVLSAGETRALSAGDVVHVRS